MEADPQYQAMLANFQQQMAPQQQPQAQGPSAAPGAKTIFTLADGATLDDTYVAQLAAQHLGMPVAGVSPEGSALMLQNGQTVPISGVLQQLGAQVQGFRPLQADYSQAQPQLRAALATLPDDYRRKQYLSHHMEQQGLPNAMIEGSGDDWFVYDPGGQRWMAATNAPGMDATDAAGALISGTKLLGAIGGSIAGAGLGPAGVIGGAAAGGAGANALQKAGFEMFDPTYAAVREGIPEGDILGDIGTGAAVDAAGAALPIAGGAVLGRMMGAGGQVAAAPVSRALGAGGGIAQGGGAMVNRMARAVDNPLGRDVAAAMIPGASQAQMLGIGAQLPAMALRGGMRAAGHLGESALGRGVLGEEAAAGLAGFSKRILQPGIQGEQAGARQMLSELGGSMGRGLGRRMPGPTPDDLAPYLNEARVYKQNLVDLGSEEQLAKELWRDEMAAKAGGYGRTAGSYAGELVESLERVGKGADQFARGISGPAIKALRYGGAGMEQAGRGASAIGAAGRNYRGLPLEDQLYGQLGAEEAYSRLPHASLDPYEALLKERQSYLAGGY